MTRKIIYSLILICFIGLLSSANQNNKNCQKEAYWLAARTNCALQCQKTIPADAGLVPLNLFLFDL
ncbi:MAG: hypothetical protein JWM28_3503 [Chitinophagaceae bacterium]|nr:hypothetical protein [Chitinophagaceae bacterium]